MQKLWLKLCSIILVIVMVVNMLPMTAWAETNHESLAASSETPVSSVSTGSIQESAMAETQIVGEVIENRTEYTKEFRLDNGLYVAAVYNQPVHYQEDGQWLEIDNTLVTSSDGKLTNTAGVWDVSFPQQLSKTNPVTITKDGYTLSFFMAGELRSSGNLEIMSAGEDAVASVMEDETASVESEASAQNLGSELDLETASVKIDGTVQTFAVSSAQTSVGAVQQIDLTEAKATAQYEELVTEKNASQLLYSNVYGNTDVQYDLQGSKVKESIILNAYDGNLRGYRYTLNVGDMVPVLYNDGSVEFYDAQQEEIVMYMPAPYLVDDAQEHNYDIHVNLTGSNGVYTLTYILPTSWLASADREWPVVLDPVVTTKPDVANTRDHTVASNGSYSHLRTVLECGYGPSYHKHWFFIKYRTLPALKSSDVVLSATISLYKPENASIEVPVNVHKVLGTWESETLTWSNKPGYDPTIEDYAMVTGSGWYNWDVTDIARGWYSGVNTGMMFKAADEYEDGTNTNTWKQFASSDNGAASWLPSLTIIYRDSTGLENYWDYTSASAGRAGSGYVNSYTGNLVWTRGDLGFGGNRMPVSISHIYNLSDNNINDFGVGYGWRTNFNQKITSTTINGSKYYIWDDADGTSHYFYNESYGVFKDEDGLELTLRSVNVASNTGVTGGQYSITDKVGNVSVFDANGRLIRQINNQQTKSSITITYTTTGKLIDKITDGVGRVYDFTYSNGLLSRIDYYGTTANATTPTSFAHVTFGYDANSNLISVTDKDGISRYSYNADSTAGTSDDHILHTAQDIDGYKLKYSFYTPVADFQPFRVMQVKEYSGTTAGGELNIEYAHNQTTFTDHNGNVEIVQFNNFGNVVSIQDDEGHAQHAQYAINNTDETGKANQLKLSSRMQNTVVNILQNSSFEGVNTWTKESGSNPSIVTTQAYLGAKSLSITNTAEIKSVEIVIPSGATYTFSAYVKTGTNNTAKLTLHDGTTAYASNVLAKNSDWTRLETSYTNSGTSPVNLTARLVTTGTGTTYMDCVQVEQAATASRYNLVQNGDFRTSEVWPAVIQPTNNTPPPYTYEAPTDGTTLLPSAAPQMNNVGCRMVGDPTAENRISQTVTVSGAEGDNFILAGWAKGDSAPLPEAETGEDQRQFALIGTFNYTDDTTSEEFIVQFNPDTNVAESWQYAAGVMVAEKAYESVTIEIAYDYNVNIVYFDGIQLYKEQFGSRYYYDDDGNVTKIEDAEGEETTYQYTNNDLTKEILPTGVELDYTYDGYHNVTQAETSDGQIYNFTYDTYGNNTSVSITNSTGQTMSSIADYTSDGNRLESTTDAAGNTTNYTYDVNTNLLLKVQYPGNNANTYTEYTYDNMHRMSGVESIVNSTSVLSAEYFYQNDLLKTIVTNSTTYTFNYGAFSLRSNVKIGSRTLASYTYTSDRNNYLQRLAYGNGDSVQYEYDNYGRLIKQYYYENNSTTVDATVTYQYDNDGALAAVTDSDTGITTKYYYDFSGSTAATELRKGADIILRVSEGFDENNRLTEQNITFANESYKNLYTYNANGTLSGIVLGRATSATSGGLAQITYTYDGFLRLSGRTSGKNSQTYTYYTDGTATTSQVTQLKYENLSGTPTFSYIYDEKGNIEKYTAPGKSQITYTYDANNQLISADGATDYSYTYDNAGNITKAVKNGTIYTYTYGDSAWGDLLTAYNGNTITYDTIGNPTAYYNGWNFTWEHGREMATATKGTTSLSFKYDANGLRTSKTVNGVEHTYYYYGGKLLRETYSGNTLDFYYDASGVPYMLEYNGTLYYYVTNAQGDVIRIVDSSGASVADYEYDPYGASVTATGTLATINPLRYRGYYYDVESGLYYLQSRYYDPELGRFLNADAFTSTGQGALGNNMFAYCLNNPTNMADTEGTDAFYVTQTDGNNSLPIVGHALLYVQDADGNWYVTEFTGNSKPNARVKVYPASQETVDAMLSSTPQSGKQYTFIEGDFSSSLDLARDYEENNPTYDGYGLLWNNCLHYVKEILFAGTFDNKWQKDYLMNSSTIIPTAFHTDIVRSESYSILREVVCR